MKGSSKVIGMLNEVLTGELTAINQYFLHAKMCKHWGYAKIHKKIYEESIDEMKHASVLVDRILFLDGIPNLQKLDKLHIGESVPEMLASDMQLEVHAIERLKKGIELCWAERDYASREMLEKILIAEEEHYEWIEEQQNVIKDIGLPNYLAQTIEFNAC